MVFPDVAKRFIALATERDGVWSGSGTGSGNGNGDILLMSIIRRTRRRSQCGVCAFFIFFYSVLFLVFITVLCPKATTHFCQMFLHLSFHPVPVPFRFRGPWVLWQVLRPASSASLNKFLWLQLTPVERVRAAVEQIISAGSVRFASVSISISTLAGHLATPTL